MVPRSIHPLALHTACAVPTRPAATLPRCQPALRPTCSDANPPCYLCVYSVCRCPWPCWWTTSASSLTASGRVSSCTARAAASPPAPSAGMRRMARTQSARCAPLPQCRCTVTPRCAALLAHVCVLLLSASGAMRGPSQVHALCALRRMLDSAAMDCAAAGHGIRGGCVSNLHHWHWRMCQL